MWRRPLADTSTKISAIGQGTIGAGKDRTLDAGRIRRRIETLRLGIDLGMTFLDTGEDYEDGHAEEIVGRAVERIREKVFIGSKFSPSHHSYQAVLDAAHGSLRRLRTDRIDLYQMHWPNAQISLEETLSALLKLIQGGKIRYIGVGNLTEEELRQARLFAGSYLVSLQTEYSLFNRAAEKDLLPFCLENKLTMIAYGSLGYGNARFTSEESKLLNELSRKYEATIYQLMIRWMVQSPCLALVIQSMNPVHMRENAGAVGLNLSAGDMERIGRAFKREPIFIPTGKIKISVYDADESHAIYTTLEEALENRHGLRPSPSELAQEIKSGKCLRPVEVVEASDETGRCRYVLTRGRVRYWAWRIAHGEDRPILAYVQPGKVGVHAV